MFCFAFQYWIDGIGPKEEDDEDDGDDGGGTLRLCPNSFFSLGNYVQTDSLTTANPFTMEGRDTGPAY